MGNYVIAVGNYVIVSPSELGNYKIADTIRKPDATPQTSRNLRAVPLQAMTQKPNLVTVVLVRHRASAGPLATDNQFFELQLKKYSAKLDFERF
jgi:hypothetical protein